MASKRALFVMDRPLDARIARGLLVENEHVAMFSTKEEFISVVKYYSTHEAERMRIVNSAYRMATMHHD